MAAGGTSRMPVNPGDQQHPIVVEMVSALDEIQREHFEERSGVFEFEACLDRSLAEALALLDLIRLYGWPQRQK